MRLDTVRGEKLVRASWGFRPLYLAPLRLGAAILIIFPAIVNLLYIHRFGVNIPIYDQWTFIPLFSRLYTGHLTFSDLFAPYNGHRIIVPRLIMLGVGALTHYNNLVEMYLSWVATLAILAVLYASWSRFTTNSVLAIWLFVPVAWLVYGLRQYENIINGWNLQIYLVVLFVLLSLYFLILKEVRPLNVTLSIVFAILSSFCYANGLLIWPAGLLAIWLTRGCLKSRRFAAWSIAGGLTLLIYIWRFGRSSFGPDPLFSIHHPETAASFFASAVGAPYAVTSGRAVAFGLLIIASIGVATYTTRFTTLRNPPGLFSLSLVLFSMLSDGMLTFGRSSLGLEQAMASRYVTFSYPAVLGVYFLLAAWLWAERGLGRGSMHSDNTTLAGLVTAACMVALVIHSVVAGTPYAIAEGSLVRNFRKVVAYEVLTYKFQDDESFAPAYPPSGALVRRGAAIMERYHLNVFNRPADTPGSSLSRDARSPVEGRITGTIDAVNGSSPTAGGAALVMRQSVSLTISGWAVDQSGRPPQGLQLAVDGRPYVPVQYGLSRPDVALELHDQAFVYSGFYGSLSTRLIQPGPHALQIRIDMADGRIAYLPKSPLYIDVRR